jgi:carbonic anhydrase/acetyltransferase-like protein (isoleucine patch superfamily)
VIPDGQLVLGSVARVKGPLTESARWWVEGNPEIYRQLAKRHRASVTPVIPDA